ncbi:MAG: efflux RND transporter periplasmic adaptor subunit [Gammaproteobacteria bacterium]|nr:MAG: efflux RND transporter periplasmic adaptor subunit [Gammaproteobacteria bacterium]
MKKSMQKFALPLAAIVGLLLMIAWMAGLFSEKIPPGINTPAAVSLAEAVPVVAADVTIIEKVPASVEATQATLISSRLMAQIVAVNVRAGDTVSRGDLILELENSDIKAQVRQAEAYVRATSARLKEAKQTLARVQELQAGGVVSISDLDKAVANHETLIAEMTGANQALEEARTALSYSEIVAPFDGRIVDRFAEPGDTAQPGSKLLALYNPLNLRVEARVREYLALGLEAGQPLQVEIPSLEKIVDAVIEERVPAADPGSRSFLVKAGVAFDKDLLPGMYARLLVPSGSEKQLLVPADRVVHSGQLHLVWVAQDGHSSRRFVRIGQTVNDGQIEILSGLAEGDLILPVP